MTDNKANLRTLSIWAGEEKKDGWQRAIGIPESLIRYSVGIEDVNDLIADLE